MKKFTLSLGLVGLILLILLLVFFPAFGSFGESLLFLAIFLAVFYLFDRYVIKEIDTIEELKSGNVAYAIFLVAIAILFLAVAILVG
jgi:hypothetical protein